MKRTSIKSYYEEKESGHITVRHKQILDILKYNDVLTAKMISAKIPHGWKRLSELESMGCIRICGTTQDIDTNKMVSVYKFVSYKPLDNKTSVKKPKYIVPIKLAEYYDSAYIQGIKDALFWAGYKRIEIDICVKRVKEAQK